MKLYEFHRAPNPRRVRFFMAEKPIDPGSIETIQIDIGAGENLGEAFRALNPMSGVPVLELDDGTCLSESMAICRYFEARHPEPALMGRDAIAQATIEMWNRRMEFNLLLPVAMAFRHTTGHFADREQVFADYGQDSAERARRMFDFLNTHLAGQAHIAGPDFSVADITAAVSIDFARIIQMRVTRETHPHLADWHERVSARPAASA